MHVRDVFHYIVCITNPLPNSMIVDSGLSETETKNAPCGGMALKPPHSSTLSFPHGAEN